MASHFGEEPDTYKVLVYSKLTPEEVAKTNVDIRKVSFWDITASVPGSTAVDDPHVSVFWYGPNVSAEKGLVIHMKGHHLDKKYTDPIAQIVAAKVGGTTSRKESEAEFKNFIMKISYANIADLASEIQRAGKLNCECTFEFEMVSKEEKAQLAIPKAKLLGEQTLEK